MRIPEFRYFIGNSFLITATLLIQEVILGYELYRITHDPLALGLVGLAEAIPFIALSLFGGHLADRGDKKRILQWSLGLITLGSVILYLVFQPRLAGELTQTTRLATIYGVLMLIGTARGFYSPASSSLKPFLVPRELYANSATWSSSFWQAGAIVGPGVAGFLYALVGFDNTLLVVIGLFILCFVLISLIDKKPVPVNITPQANLWASLREGFSFVFSTKIVLYAISLDLFSVLFGGVVAILPVFAEDILKVGAEGLGVLRAAPAVGCRTNAAGYVALSAHAQRLAEHAAGRCRFWRRHAHFCHVYQLLPVCCHAVSDGGVRQRERDDPANDFTDFSARSHARPGSGSERHFRQLVQRNRRV